MEETSISRYDDFMKKVEAGEPYIYPENPSYRKAFLYVSPALLAFPFLFLLPILAGSFPILWDYGALIFFGLLFGVPFISIFYRFWLLYKCGVGFGFINYFSRLQISASISFLDMVLMGHEKVGDIPESSRAVEFRFAHIRSLGSTHKVLKKSIPDLSIKWIGKVEDQLGESLPSRSRSESVSYIYLVIMLFLTAYWIADFMGLLGEQSLYYSSIISFIYLIVTFSYLCIVTRTKEIGASESLVKIIEEIDMKEETKVVLESLIQVIRAKCKCPIRTFVIGEYSGLKYVDYSIKTSSELTLRAAVLLPSNDDHL